MRSLYALCMKLCTGAGKQDHEVVILKLDVVQAEVNCVCAFGIKEWLFGERSGVQGLS